MDTNAVGRWVTEYERAWRDCDAPAVRDLFTEDAQYLTSPYEEPLVGHEAIEAFWNDPQPFEMEIQSLTVDGSHAVVRVRVTYRDPEQEYLDLWELDFASDGRVERFVEWAYWPGKSFTA